MATSDPKIKIHPETLIHSDSVIRGRITFDAGCVVHPHASIDAGDGEIVFGVNNIVEETAVIENREPGHKMVIGDNNMFEIGAICTAKSIGSNNIFGQRSVVGEKVEVPNGCVIGPKCQLLQHEPIAERTCIYGENNTRRLMHDAPPSLRTQSEFLCKQMVKFGTAFKNKS